MLVPPTSSSPCPSPRLAGRSRFTLPFSGAQAHHRSAGIAWPACRGCRASCLKEVFGGISSGITSAASRLWPAHREAEVAPLGGCARFRLIHGCAQFRRPSRLQATDLGALPQRGSSAALVDLLLHGGGFSMVAGPERRADADWFARFRCDLVPRRPYGGKSLRRSCGSSRESKCNKTCASMVIAHGKNSRALVAAGIASIHRAIFTRRHSCWMDGQPLAEMIRSKDAAQECCRDLAATPKLLRPGAEMLASNLVRLHFFR